MPKASITGTVIVFNRIPALIAFVEAESRAAVKKNADAIVRDAKALAPVDTGALRSSIQAVSIEAGKEADVEVNVSYAAYVEYGTYKMAAQPYLSPAVIAHTDEFFEDVGRGLFARF